MSATTTTPALCPGCAHPWADHRQRVGSCASTGCSCEPTCARCGAGWTAPCATPTGQRHSGHPRVAARTARRLAREADEAARVQAWRDAREKILEGWRQSDARWDRLEALISSALGHDDAALRLLGLERGATVAQVKTAFRERVKAIHPDLGGTADGEGMAALVAARERALRAVKGAAS